MALAWLGVGSLFQNCCLVILVAASSFNVANNADSEGRSRSLTCTGIAAATSFGSCHQSCASNVNGGFVVLAVLLVGLHMQAPGNNQIPMTSAALQGFNTYKIVWGCDSVTWYVNDKLGLTVLKSDLPNWPFDQPFYIIMNLAVGGNLPGNDVDLSGGDLTVEYVKVYTAAA